MLCHISSWTTLACGSIRRLLYQPLFCAFAKSAKLGEECFGILGGSAVRSLFAKAFQFTGFKIAHTFDGLERSKCREDHVSGRLVHPILEILLNDPLSLRIEIKFHGIALRRQL